jgi:hypothetical protein
VSGLFKVLLVITVALGAAAAAVIEGDTKTVVPPPESVVEQFARHVAARRYDRALQHVDDRSGITLATVRLRAEALRERAGRIDQVEGQAGMTADDSATASAVLTTRRGGRIRYACSLERRNGLWKIAAWEENP